jgi:hypothetical protein
VIHDGWMPPGAPQEKRDSIDDAMALAAALAVGGAAIVLGVFGVGVWSIAWWVKGLLFPGVKSVAAAAI